MSDYTYEIKQHHGAISQNEKGWQKELNLVSWNGKEAKLEIREWAPDHARAGKGITITHAEAATLYEILQKLKFEQII